jgi:hypothetical protein
LHRRVSGAKPFHQYLDMAEPAIHRLQTGIEVAFAVLLRRVLQGGRIPGRDNFGARPAVATAWTSVLVVVMSTVNEQHRLSEPIDVGNAGLLVLGHGFIVCSSRESSTVSSAFVASWRSRFC